MKHLVRFRIGILALNGFLILVSALSILPASAQNFIWTRQFGTAGTDEALGVSVNGSAIYVAGVAGDALPGQTSAGLQDAFVRKYDVDGNVQWTSQFGSAGADKAFGVTAGISGIYAAGFTEATLFGQASAGGSDAFVRKYDLDGNVEWTLQFGTPSEDIARAVSLDVSAVYVAGHTHGTFSSQTSFGGLDAFVRKYDLNGNEEWTRQFGTLGNDAAYAVSVDVSGVYVAGIAGGALPGQISTGPQDAFVRKYASNGNEVWTRQVGTPPPLDDAFCPCGAFGISVGSSGVYVTGNTGSVLPGQTNSGSADAFVRKYDLDGNEKWTRQFGTPSEDTARGVFVGVSGVYVTGDTPGTFPGQMSGGGANAFVRRYDFDGNDLWTTQFGSPNTDFGVAVSVDFSGVYVAGLVSDALPGETFAGGFEDAFLVKLEPGLVTIKIDIKPGSFPNSINVENRGTIPVAIISTSKFDAPSTVDRSSLTFGRTGDEASLAFCSASAEDVNMDGLLDLVCHFKTQLTGFRLGDTEGVLRGQLRDRTLIEGKDSVRVIL